MNNEFVLLKAIPVKGGETASLFREARDDIPVPYSVQFRGSGHYFETLRDCLRFLVHRRLISSGKAERLEAQLTDHCGRL